MVVGEPEGSMTWYPVSDHQTDKATYDFQITVPEGKVAVANGLPAQDPITANGWTTWYWDAPDQQASYLTTASVGDYDLRFSETADGLPIIDAVDDNLTPANAATTEASLALQADMIAFLEEEFVPYPFNSYGSIVDDERRLCTRDADPAGVLAGRPRGHSPARARPPVVREHREPGALAGHLAQRGLGHLRRVAVERATDDATAQELFDDVMAIPAEDEFWDLTIADPGPFGLFLGAIYDRGAATPTRYG